MPRKKSATNDLIPCDCCKRLIPSDTPEGKCWECRGRTHTTAHVAPPAGLRDPSCPHERPEDIH